MAGEEMAKRDGERRRSRAGSNLNVNFNSGGVVLLLGAAAGALLASAFAAHRVRAHKKTRGSITDGSQGDSGEHLASRETKDFASDEAGEGNGANAGEGAVQVIVRKKSVQVNSHESLDASVQISQVDLREIDFYLLEEGKGEVAERGPTTDIELVDGDHRKLAGCRDSLSADISSSPPNVYRELGISNSLGENQISCDDEELVAASINEKHKNSFLNCKEDDEEGTKKVYLEERSEREEAEEKLTSSNQFSEQPRLIEGHMLDWSRRDRSLGRPSRPCSCTKGGPNPRRGSSRSRRREGKSPWGPSKIKIEIGGTGDSKEGFGGSPRREIG